MVAQTQGIRPIVTDSTIEPRSPGVGDMLKMEALKMRRRPMTWVTFLIVMLAVVAIPVLGYIAINASTFANPAQKAEELQSFLLPNGITLGLEISTIVGSIVLTVLAAGIIGSEYGWGTTRVLVGSGADRTRLMVAKILYVALITLMFVLAGTFVGSLTSLAVTVVTGNELTLGGFSGAWLVDLALMLLRGFFVTFVSAVIGFAVASMTRSLAAGIAVGIGIGALEPILSALLSLAGTVGDIVNQFLLFPNINSIVALNGFGEVTPPANALNPWQAAAVLTGYIVLLLGASIIIFRRRDIPSGS